MKRDTECGLREKFGVFPGALFPPHFLLLAPLALAGCSGRQSALDPAGGDAERIAELFWWMTGGSAVVWVV